MVIKILNCKVDLIEIYDKCGKLVAKEKNSTSFSLPFDVYCCKCYYCGNFLFSFTFIYRYSNQNFCYIYKNKITKTKFYVTDYYYSGLKIEGGNIFLWNAK